MLTRQEKVAIFAPDMRDGGAQRVAKNLSQSIARRGHQVDLVLAQATGPYLAEGIDPARLVALKARRVLSSIPALVRYLRRERPMAMVSYLDYTNIVALWARRLSGIPVRLVVSEQNSLAEEIDETNDLRMRLMPRLIHRFYPWADLITAVSEGAADTLATTAELDRGNVRVVYNPVVTGDLRRKAEARVDHPWFEPGQPPVLLAVGRLAPQKDFPTLLQAFAHLRTRCRARLMILGEGEKRLQLEAQIRDLNLQESVDLPGFVANPYAYMSNAAAFVLSSNWEGLPAVLIEALYCGARVVATDCPSGPNEILAGGRYGTLVPVGNPAALAQAMQEVIVDPPQRPPRESWEPYESERVTDQYIEFLLKG